MDFKTSQHVFISANKCRHVTSLITALFPKCTTVSSSAVCSRREKGQRFTVVKYESNAVDIFILLHSMVNRCKNPEIQAVARSELNSWVGYLVNFISNRFLSYKTHIWNRIRAKTNGKPWRQLGGLTDDCLHYATDSLRSYIGPSSI